MSEQATQSKKISVGLILSWIFGILFTLTGIVFVFSEPIPGLVMLIMAAVLLPPVTKLVDQKWKFHLSKGIKIGVIVIGLIIFGATIDTSNVSTTQKPEISKGEEQLTDNENVTDETTTANQVDEEQPQNKNNEPKDNETETSQPVQNKEMRILQEQKERAEEITRTAVNLITENKIPKTVDLYNDRWNEIAQLRVDIMHDKELTDEEKKNIDQALEKEQESITDILSEYQQLY